jgi:peptidoglycan/xylan/chitin deacetylase (PgdA/CDA1 family)
MAKSAVPFLMYHNILPEGDPYTITKEMFRKQMALLKENEYNVIAVRDFVSQQKTFEKQTKKNVCLTFDDGYANNFTYCLPELEKYNFKATFYITTSLINTEIGFTEDQVRTLSEKGMEFGSHTVNHVFLSNLTDDKLYYELEESKTQLEDIIQKSVTSLSLPGGRGNKRIFAAAQKAGYNTLCTSVYHPNDAHTNLFSLGRIPIKKDCSIELFEKIVSLDLSIWKSMRFKQDIKFIIQKILGNRLYHSIWKMKYE